MHYNIGPSPPHLQLNLVNEVEYVTNPIWNVIGIINGTNPSEVIVLGNHRDAWIAGGAGDPNSGSAALNEVIRSFGLALQKGWKPQRTIVFASWDGEEYGLVGSTEWVEEYITWLNTSTIAYLNVDVGARGSHFDAAASPLLHEILYEVTSLVQSPNQTVANTTVCDTWSGRIRTMGSGSDFTAFQDFAGIPSLDIGFANDPNQGDAVYHYHSNYDSFAWMDKYGDQDWAYHVTIAKIWALLAARLSEEPFVRMRASDYAKGLIGYLDSVKEKAGQSSIPVDKAGASFNFTGLTNASTTLLEAATAFDLKVNSLATDLLTWESLYFFQKIRLYWKIFAVNKQISNMERSFIYDAGLDERPWFKHVVFAPGRWTGYAGATFPGLVEAFEDGNLTSVERWSGIIVERMGVAEKGLKI